MRIQSSQMCQAILARNLCHTMNLNIWRVIKNYILPTFFLKSTCDFLVTPQIWHAPTSRGHIFVYFGLLYTVRICGQRIQLLACPFFSHAGVDYLFMLYTQFWFISNTANFQPVSNLRFSIVIACECCLVSKKQPHDCCLFSKKTTDF